jgi:hypothetical protein
MRRKSDELFKKIRGAVPADEAEEQIFDLAMEEQRLEKIADAVAEQLALSPKKPPGAPRKTEGDPKYIEELFTKHHGDMKLVQRDFLKVIGKRDDITKKSCGERYRKALRAFKSRNTK